MCPPPKSVLIRGDFQAYQNIKLSSLNSCHQFNIQFSRGLISYWSKPDIEKTKCSRYPRYEPMGSPNHKPQCTDLIFCTDIIFSTEHNLLVSQAEPDALQLTAPGTNVLNPCEMKKLAIFILTAIFTRLTFQLPISNLSKPLMRSTFCAKMEKITAFFQELSWSQQNLHDRANRRRGSRTAPKIELIQDLDMIHLWHKNN